MDDKKVYYSSHDMPIGSGEYRNNDIQRSDIRFSREEIVQIFIAMAVLTIAFSFAFVTYPPLSHLNEVIGWSEPLF